MGQRCKAADLCLGTALVSARIRRNLFNRARVPLGPSRRTCRQQRRVACQSILAGGSCSRWIRRLHSVADALLVWLERYVSPSSLRRRVPFFVAADSRNSPRALP